ncbi:hypothetical protein DITRI_Ditri14bG0086300 [Diplodiscus trichospermus]
MGQAYGCESCKYFLHKTCAKLSHEVLHPLHPQHPLGLSANEDIFFCDECRTFTNGFNYVCYECDFKLDVKCATSTAPNNENQGLKEIERDSTCFFCRHHSLVFFNTRHLPFEDFKCAACCLPNLGPTYFCPNCLYPLHESCLGFPRGIQLPILQGSPLHPVLVGHNHTACSACSGTISKRIISYRYRQPRYSLNFHLQCANSLTRAIQSTSHEHPVFYFGTECQKLFAGMMSTSLILKCNQCRKSCTGLPFYRCFICDINLHLECVPIPHFIKSECHFHPFILKKYFVEDDLGEYYCDVCEKERHPQDHVYYCKKCRGLFIAHIKCVLNQVSQHL